MRILRGAVSTLGALGALLAGAALAVRALGIESGPLVVLIAATPYAVVLAAVSALILVLSGSRFWLGACLVVLLGLAATQAPLVLPDRQPAGQRSLTVMTTNLRFGGGNPDDVVKAVRSGRVDVLAIQELTQQAAERLSAAGLDGQLPHHYLVAEPGHVGSGLWSRLPLSGMRQLPGFRSAQLVVDVQPAQGGKITVVAVHPNRPQAWDNSTWSAEQARLGAVLRAMPGTVVAAGDFNATSDHSLLRRLSGDGFADAAGQAGAGLVRTWPLGKRVPWPLFGIDHVLVRGPLTATTVRTVAVADTDHAGLVAELHISPGAASR